MVQSKLRFFLYPAAVFVAACSGLLLFIVYVIIRENVTNLADFELVMVILLLTWFAVLFLVGFQLVMVGFRFHENKLEVRYIFGLIKQFYYYNDLRVSEYFWSTNGILIETSNGDQFTLGEKQYTNYSELKEAFQSRIKKDVIKIKYTTRMTRVLLFLGVALTVLLIIAMKLK